MRKAEVNRKTKETDIQLSLCLDGDGVSEIDTGIAFFDHMLSQLATHGGMALRLKCRGDLQVDGHHTVEDVGIVLGAAFKDALGGKEGIRRYASACIPMDETLCRAVVDISGRPYLHYKVGFPNLSECFTGTYDPVLTEEFFRAFVNSAGVTLHAEALYGNNTHHITEAVFKAFSRALRDAVKIDGGNTVPSSKGSL